MATYDRHSQWDPIPALSVKALLARLANDDATNAMAAQQATVDAARTKATLLEIHPNAPATAANYVAYGQALAAYEVENAKLPALQAAQSVTRDNWNAARSAFLEKASAGAIDNDPGAIEQV